MERKPDRLRKSTARHDRQIVKIVKVDPRKMAVNVTNYANERLGISIVAHTARD